MSSQPTLRILDHTDLALHPAYCDYVAQVFSQADFRRWCEWDQWAPGYRAYSLFEDGRVVANASTMRQRLIVGGEEIVAFQFGAVGCLPERRGRGLARRAMQAALAECGDAPALLFANDSVLAFYPRFGFAPAPQALFEAPHAVEPAPRRAPRLDLADPAVRARFLALAARAAPTGGRFASRDYGRVATWYAANGFAAPLFELDPDTWVFAREEDGVLEIEDVVAAAPSHAALAAALPRLIERPVRALRFGFDPERLWPQARASGPDDDAGLFLRGLDPSRLGPHSRFPVLART
ncbi:GNAT family N-acetyltransferase [Lysobacter enzymogenes]|uniref:GNAT family N-acetyltransferase n=1 Tax=Lysobacter enzymogenes TaxID=69 RepID=UPI0008943C61|nr:GNAT family N-acetyltransferase [Lysobacter enzymogenes]SDW88990.1 Acetyltransferase (GNAT) domain-containing protein [Lysobacter enzymogenes]